MGSIHWMIPPEEVEKKFGWPKGSADMYTTTGKVEMTEFFEATHAVFDSAGSCLVTTFQIFALDGADMETYAKALTAMTGTQYDAQKVLECGRRIVTLERAFNVREGWGRELYTAADKWFEQPMTEGLQKGWVLDREVINKLIDEFLAKRGFDPKTNFPYRATLEKLDLGFVVDVLKKMKRLAEKKASENEA
jgi:aldehyde:ferredoxin oxidoreductase